MTDRISCPQCDFEFEISEALSNDLRKRFEQEFAQERKKREADFLAREAKLQQERENIRELQANAEKEVATRLEEALVKRSAELKAELREASELELKQLQEELLESRSKLKEARGLELELRKQERALLEEKENLALELARKEAELRKSIETELKQRFSQESDLKLAERDNLIKSMNAQIDDLKRRLEQGSQQAQGESLETTLETQLQLQFPFDTILPVAKGTRGGDVVQTVHDSNATAAGSILWELKRTKHWQNDWLPKLRDDQRAVKAEVAVLVTQVLPRELKTFGLVDGVWVCSIGLALPLACALRETLLQTHQARAMQQGQQGKMELLYAYLAGPEFKQRLEGIAETFHSLREDLEKEKRAMQSIWSKREKQLERAVVSASGLYGDLQGIIGASLEGIEYFALESIANAENE